MAAFSNASAEAGGGAGSTNEICVNRFTIQSTSSQDYSWYDVEDGITRIVTLDGHGTHKGLIPDKDLITWLKEYNWKELIQNRGDRNPIIILEENIAAEYSSTRGIGAAISIVEIIESKVTIWWKGDAGTKIFRKDHEGKIDIVAATSIPSDEEEIKRIGEVFVKPGWQVSAISESGITMRPNSIFIFNCDDKVGMSQCVGHDGLTGMVDQKIEYILEDDYDYKIIVASDGLWDIMAFDNSDVQNKVWKMESDEIAIWAVSQWKRTDWVYTFGEKSVYNQEIGDVDDVTCVVWMRTS